MTGTQTQLWRGWWRPNRRGKWVVIAEGKDEQTVHDEMLDGRHGGDFLLSPPGAGDPNETSPARRG
jgi:hypothetical protein